VGSMLTQMLITLLVSLEFFGGDKTPFMTILFTCASIFQLCYWIFFYPLWNEYSWRFFKLYGVDPVKQKRVRTYLKFMVMLRIDLLLVFLTILLSGHDSIPLDIATFLVSCAFTCTGYISCKKELAPLLYSFWVLALVVPVYIAYIYYKILSERDILGLFANRGLNETAMASFFTVIALICGVGRVILMVFSILIHNGFGEEVSVLKTRFFAPQNIRKENPGYVVHTIGTALGTDGETGGETDIDFTDGEDEEEDLSVDDVLRNTYEILDSVEIQNSSKSNSKNVQHHKYRRIDQ